MMFSGMDGFNDVPQGGAPVYIQSVQSDSAAEDAGLRASDRCEVFALTFSDASASDVYIRLNPVTDSSVLSFQQKVCLVSNNGFSCQQLGFSKGAVSCML